MAQPPLSLVKIFHRPGWKYHPYDDLIALWPLSSLITSVPNFSFHLASTVHSYSYSLDFGVTHYCFADETMLFYNLTLSSCPSGGSQSCFHSGHLAFSSLPAPWFLSSSLSSLLILVLWSLFNHSFESLFNSLNWLFFYHIYQVTPSTMGPWPTVFSMAGC